MTEVTDNELFKYTFSSLPKDDYVFKIIASDGAQTDIEYVAIKVRESEIDVKAVSFFGVGADFTQMTFSFDINKDSTYSIEEASENVAESETHSGSVTEGLNNLAWDKLDTADEIVNFTITFENGTLSRVVEGQYQVAQTVLEIRSYFWGFTQNEVSLNVDMSKTGNYAVYLDDVQTDTGALVTGSNFINWSRPTSTDPSEVRAAVKVFDAANTFWLNQTYDEYTITAFAVRTVLFSVGTVNIIAFAQTSFNNATCYLYENDVLKDTGAEGTYLEYSLSTSINTYEVSFKIDAGGSNTVWVNDSYVVEQAPIIISNPTYLEFRDSSFWSLSGETNQAINYYVYDNNTLVDSGTKTTGFFSVSQNFVNTIGKHIIKIKLNTSTDTAFLGGSYDIDTTLLFDSYDPDQDNATCSIGFRVVRTASTTLTYTIYEIVSGETLIESGSFSVTTFDFVSIEFQKSAANIDANATIIISDGTSTRNITIIYLVFEPKTVSNTYGGGLHEGDIVYKIENQTIVDGDYYEQAAEPPQGVFLDQTTALIFSVGGVILIIVAYAIIREWRYGKFFELKSQFQG
jgi:hypothetical protein